MFGGPMYGGLIIRFRFLYLEMRVVCRCTFEHCSAVDDLGGRPYPSSELVVERQRNVSTPYASRHQRGRGMRLRGRHGGTFTDFHLLRAGLDVGAVRVISHVRHRYERMVQRLTGGYSSLLK